MCILEGQGELGSKDVDLPTDRPVKQVFGLAGCPDEGSRVFVNGV